jgi:hypothetical protein
MADDQITYLNILQRRDSEQSSTKVDLLQPVVQSDDNFQTGSLCWCSNLSKSVEELFTQDFFKRVVNFTVAAVNSNQSNRRFKLVIVYRMTSGCCSAIGLNFALAAPVNKYLLVEFANLC